VADSTYSVDQAVADANARMSQALTPDDEARIRVMARAKERRNNSGN